jgi:uncharacterized membrane protein (UPF0127 family)
MKFFVFIMIIFTLVSTLATTDSFAAQKQDNASELLYSDRNKPIYYARANIILKRNTLPNPSPTAQPELSQKDSVDEDANSEELKTIEKPIIAPYPPLMFDVEIRDGNTLYNQNDWFNLSSYSNKTGVMMVFDKPDKHPIVHSNQYPPVDILFINKHGKVTQIAPNIILSELDQSIYPKSSILAFIFLKGGICTELSINVGDEVQHSLFKKPPTILN